MLLHAKYEFSNCNISGPRYVFLMIESDSVSYFKWEYVENNFIVLKCYGENLKCSAIHPAAFQKIFFRLFLCRELRQTSTNVAVMICIIIIFFIKTN